MLYCRDKAFSGIVLQLIVRAILIDRLIYLKMMHEDYRPHVCEVCARSFKALLILYTLIDLHT